MNNEQLDESHSNIVNELVDKALAKIIFMLPVSEKYSEFNILMNVLMGCISKIGTNFISPDQREDFLKSINNNLHLNLMGKNEKQD